MTSTVGGRMAGRSRFGRRSISDLFLTTLLCCVVSSQVRAYQRTVVSECVPIHEPLCRGLFRHKIPKHLIYSVPIAGAYNMTSMPNILGHEEREEASARLAEFGPLIRNKCSRHVKFFLCSLHFPMCDEKVRLLGAGESQPVSTSVCQIPFGIPACREMCLDVREKCEPYLEAFHLTWPESIRCAKLPPASSHRCLVPREMAPLASDKIEALPRGKHRKPNIRKHAGRKKAPRTTEPRTSSLKTQTESQKYPETIRTTTTSTPDPETDPSDIHRWSPVTIESRPTPGERPNIGDVIQVQSVDRRERKKDCENDEKFTRVENSNKCVPVCGVNVDVMFSQRDKTFIYYWMMICSILCVISSSFTVGTCLVDSKRFRYPERPIIFLSLCYLLYATAYIIRLGRGPSSSVSCVKNPGSGISHLVAGEVESTGCTAVFFLLYFFGMAAAAWWVVLSVTWFLAAGLKWGHEAIGSKSFCFHLAGWVPPGIQTIAALMLGRVDGDELTGVCYVGNLDRSSLLYFVIVPFILYLSIGSLALSCGFLSLLRIRQVLQKSSDSAGLEKLIVKIGFFTFLFIAPQSAAIATNIYQYNNLDRWISKAESIRCSAEPNYLEPGYRDYNYEYMSQSMPDYQNYYGYAQDAQIYPSRRLYNGRLVSEVADKGKVSCDLSESIPSLGIFAIKILMSLVAGMSSGIWVCSQKTCKSWRSFCWSGGKNVNASTITGNAPSVTSQLIAKDGHEDARFFSRSRRDDVTERHVTSERGSNFLTLGDIARNYRGDFPTKTGKPPNRAAPNHYVTHHVTRHSRSRKFSESDVTKLQLTSHSGFDVVTSSTRRKAQSADFRKFQKI